MMRPALSSNLMGPRAMGPTARKLLITLLATAAYALPAAAEIAVSANDGKLTLVDGKNVVNKDGKDTISFIDLDANPPKLIFEIDAPTSVVGPPMSVAVGPKEDFALVTSAMKIDPADPAKQVPDNRVSVIDLMNDNSGPITSIKGLKRAAGIDKAEAPKPPKILATVEAGAGASGVSINKAGTLALVANRAEGTVSVFTITGKVLTPAGKIEVGGKDSGPSHVVFSSDGKSAFVTRDNDHKISVLSVDGNKVEYTKRDMNAGLRPYGIDIASGGDYGVVANIGVGQGDDDTVSVIDMKAKVPHVVNTITVGQTPEGIKISPDGKFVAVGVMNGSNKPKDSPFYQENGKLVVYARNGAQLSKIAEAPVGKWCQGIAWNKKSSIILVQCMVEQEIHVFKFAGVTAKGLTKSGTIKTTGGPAGIRTAEK
jgi:DNA-binding beta-propeller fold protein YncE